jgi:Zn-dependent alcohol dehydrogenase
MAKQISIPRSQIVALPETMDALEAAMLEPLGVAIHAVDRAKPRLLEPVALVGAGSIGLLILQVLKIAGAGDVHVIEPLAHRRAAALELGARYLCNGGGLRRQSGQGPPPARDRGDQQPLRVPRCGARLADWRPGRSCRHSVWRRLYAIGLGDAQARPEDQVRVNDVRRAGFR